MPGGRGVGVCGKGAEPPGPLWGCPPPSAPTYSPAWELSKSILWGFYGGLVHRQGSLNQALLGIKSSSSPSPCPGGQG